jgi:DNA repair protein RadC
LSDPKTLEEMSKEVNDQQWPSEAGWTNPQHPSDRFRLLGAANLSDAELLGILLQNGTPDRSAVEIGRDLLARGRNNLQELGRLSVRDLASIRGIGLAKAVRIAAAMELGRRRQATESLDKPVITHSAPVARFLQARFADLTQEVFAVVFLNQANRIIHFETISSGGLTGTVADPRIILKKALDEQAVSLILCHNHPSGNLQPSQADRDLTNKIREAARFFDIKLLDHIIVSTEGFLSFADEGWI